MTTNETQVQIKQLQKRVTELEFELKSLRDSIGWVIYKKMVADGFYRDEEKNEESK